MRFFKVIECVRSSHEAGEIVARCEADDESEACDSLGIDGSNAHLYECVAADNAADNLYDPKSLR